MSETVNQEQGMESLNVEQAASKIMGLMEPQEEPQGDPQEEPETQEVTEAEGQLEETQEAPEEVEETEIQEEEAPEIPTYRVKAEGEEHEVTLDDLKQSFQLQANVRKKMESLAHEQKEIAEFQAKDLESSGLALDIVEAYNLRTNIGGRPAGHNGIRTLIENPTNSEDEISKAYAIIEGVDMKDYAKNPEKYSIRSPDNRWAKQIEPRLAKRIDNERKANEANLKFRKAQFNEYFFVYKDSITAAVKDNPILAERTLLVLANNSEFTLPAYATSLLNNAKAELEIEETDRMNFEYNNSKLGN